MRHGVHGRRRAGSGESFWQFRPFLSGEPSSRIDRRGRHVKSALSSASASGKRRHGLDLFTVHRRCSLPQVLSQASKTTASVVLALAFADLCVRGASARVCLASPDRGPQGVVERFAESIATEERLRGPSPAALPPAIPAAPRSMVLLIGDFLSDPEDVARAVRAVSAEGAIGELVMIVDPVEETYPFSGNTEFLHPGGSLRMLTPRAQNLREAYLARLAAHRAAIRAICARSGWGMSIHRTDGAPAEILLALRMRLSAPEFAWTCGALKRCSDCRLLSPPPLFSRHWSVSSGSISYCALRHQTRVERYSHRYGFSSGLDPNETTPARTPWPILALRLAIGALIILAMAEPLWNSLAALSGSGPLLVLIDDGFAAAPQWNKRIDFARERAASAERAGRIVALGAFSQGGKDIAPLDRSGLDGRLRSLMPLPYAPDRAAALPAIERFLAREPKTDVLWIADGVERGGASAFSTRLASITHSVEVVTDSGGTLALAGADNEAGALTTHLTRSDARGPASGAVRALDAQGREVGRAAFDFGAKSEVDAHFDLPVEVRNDVTQVVIDGERSAAATWLIDERSRRRRIAIASGASADVAQPLLAPNYYLKRALQPFAESANGMIPPPIRLCRCSTKSPPSSSSPT